MRFIGLRRHDSGALHWPERSDQWLKGTKLIVIGTGAGGLTAAAYLARSGIEVLVLEQASQFGGYLNPFERRGYHFDPGVHYMGDAAREAWFTVF